MKKKYWKGHISVDLATHEDALILAGRLREADQRELWSALRMLPEEGCVESIKRSAIAYAVKLEGEVIFAFGVVPNNLIAGSGIIWLLGTERVDDMGITILRYSRAFLESFLKRWDLLENWVHAENVKSLHWLERMDFSIGEPIPYGFDDEKFCHIQIGGEKVCVAVPLSQE